MTAHRVENLADGVTLYCGDAREVIPTLSRVDASVFDPPYGIREAAGANKSRTNKATARDYGCDNWDDQTADDVVAMAIAKARWSIVFGGNYYSLPPSSCWLVWDKLNTGDFADCELAWTNLPKAVRRIQYRWNGMIRQNNEPRGDHPTQKPLGVMEWAIRQLPKGVSTILDPTMGSGTTGCSAVKLGHKFIGIERESKYFDVACRRISAALENPDTFTQPATLIIIKQKSHAAVENGNPAP